MINNKKVIVVLPAYNAALTLEKTYKEIPFDIVDEVVLVDDVSKDDTVEVANRIGIKHVIKHQNNRGYGGNQKSCYDKALELGGEVEQAGGMTTRLTGSGRQYQAGIGRRSRAGRWDDDGCIVIA